MAGLDQACSGAPGVRRADGTASRRRMVYWYLTWRCNLQCRHCWVSSSPSRSDPELDPETALRTISRLDSRRISHLVLTGGEPLFRRDWPELLEAIRAANIVHSLETNGTLITERFIEALVAGSEMGICHGINVSLDGVNATEHDALRGTGAFERAVRGVRASVEAGVNTEIQCVISKLNYRSVAGLGDLADDLGVRFLKVVLVNPVGKGAENAGELALGPAERQETFKGLAELVKTWDGSLGFKFPPAVVPPRYLATFYDAQVPRKTRVLPVTSCPFPAVGILPSGELSICALTRDHAEACLGHVSAPGFESVFDHALLTDLDAIDPERDLEGLCKDCVFVRTCGGACRAWAFVESGSFRAEFPICRDLHAQGQFPSLYRRSTSQNLVSRWREGRMAGDGHPFQRGQEKQNAM